MNVKRSSSPIRLSASASAVGCSAANALPRSASPSRSANVSTCSRAGSSPRTASTFSSCASSSTSTPTGVGVGEDVAAVLGRRVRIDRRRDATDEREREVEEAPLDARSGEDPERVALADAERQQAVRELVHPSGGLGQRYRRPFAGALREIERIGAARGHGVPPEPDDRPLLPVHGRNPMLQGFSRGERTMNAPI